MADDEQAYGHIKKGFRKERRMSPPHCGRGPGPFLSLPKPVRLEKLGSGTFGEVWRVYDSKEKKTVALKRVIKCQKYASREVHMLRHLRNEPNIAGLETEPFITKTSSDQCVLNLPLSCGDISLRSFLESVQHCGEQKGRRLNVTPEFMRRLASQLMSALNLLSKRGVMHRDIKPDNILLRGVQPMTLDSPWPRDFHLQLCDFGSAKCVSDMPHGPFSVSRYYRAPELLLGSICYGTGVDRWAAGLVLVETFLQRPLFSIPVGLDPEEIRTIVDGLVAPPDLKVVSKHYSECEKRVLNAARKRQRQESSSRRVSSEVLAAEPLHLLRVVEFCRYSGDVPPGWPVRSSRLLLKAASSMKHPNLLRESLVAALERFYGNGFTTLVLAWLSWRESHRGLMPNFANPHTG